MKQLTEIQKQTYDDIIEFYKREGIPPTVREVSELYDIQVRSAFDRLKALDKKGYITLAHGKSRGMKFLKYNIEIIFHEK